MYGLRGGNCLFAGIGSMPALRGGGLVSRFIPLTPDLLDQTVNLLVHNVRGDWRADNKRPSSNLRIDARHYGRMPTGSHRGMFR